MNKEQLTLGSLFDGSGGFPLGGKLAGVKPVFASEIEPFPIRVTTKRLPEMKHYGDVSALSGAELEPVDIITFGSPCTDLSIAGKRAGLDGEHSGLFHEAIRIVKEMREKTNGRYPRYAVWENVPGAFSSNKGEDFKAVLEAFIRIAEPEAPEVPSPGKEGWPYADVYLGAGWSVAYRTLDAQYWGVPQRRKRIYLVADFAGTSAGDILFKSEGLSGYSAESFRAWQRAAGDPAACTGTAGGAGEYRGFDGYNGELTDDVSATLGVNCGMSSGRNGVVLNDQGGSRMDVTHEVTCTLRAEAHHPPVVMDEPPVDAIPMAAGFCTEHSAKARSIGYEEEKSPTLRAGVVPAAIALDNHPTDSRVKVMEDNVIPTLTGRMGTGGNNVPLLMQEDAVPITMKIRSGCTGGGKGQICQVDKSATLGCNNDQTVFVPEKQAENQVAFGISSKDSNAMKSDNPKAGIYEASTSRTLDGNGGNPGCNQGGIAIVCVDQGAGKSSCSFAEELAPTLACTHGGEPVIAFAQNQREEVRDLGEKSGALAANPGMKQQTYVLQGSMIGREDKNGPQGDGVNEDVSFTLNTIDRHCVVAPEMSEVYAMTTGSYTQVEKEKAPTLMARDYKDPTVVNDPVSVNEMRTGSGKDVIGTIASSMGAKQFLGNQEAFSGDYHIISPQYTVRRLTPTECARLQGFPDWWCAALGTENPTEEELHFWAEVWETHRRLVSHASKPKTEKQLRKWLADPYSDSAEYKLWGNGVALPCVYFVMCGIVWAASKEG